MTALSQLDSFVQRRKVLPADFTVESEGGLISPKSFPEWGFDGSSTNQADGDASDCKLMPARVVPDPIRGVDAYLVLCEVLNPADNTPHATNTRAKLAHLMESAASEEPWIGIEQEYTMFKGSSPLGFPAERRFLDLKALTTAVSALTKYSVAK